MRQCNECRSVGDDEIFNLNLGSGVDLWLTIPCFLQDTSYVHWFHLPKKSTKKKQKNHEKRFSHQILWYCLGPHTQNPGLRVVDLESSPMNGSDKISRLRPKRKNRTENKWYCTACTHKQQCNTKRGKLGNQC